MMNLIAFLVLGLIAGFIASKLVNKTGGSLVLDIVLGVVGAFVGGYLASFVGFPMTAGTLSIPNIIIAVIGAVIVLVIYHAVMGRRAIR